MIPKTFHRIYLDEPVPEQFERFWEHLKDIHGDWSFITWDDSESLGWMRCQDEFRRCRTWAGKSDVLRYEILAAYGGVYLDCDVDPLRSFDELVESDEPFAAWEDERMICPTVMGSPPGHPAVEALLDELPKWFARHPNRPPNQQTGPHFLTAMWRDRPDVRLLPPVTFYPVHWSEKAKLGGEYPSESFAVHHWAAQWLPNGPPQRSTASDRNLTIQRT